MKKRVLFLTVAIAGLLIAIMLIQEQNVNYDQILKASVAALAWNDSGGGDGEVDCMEGEGGCTFKITLRDKDGNILRDREGNPLKTVGEIPYWKNTTPPAQ